MKMAEIEERTLRCCVEGSKFNFNKEVKKIRKVLFGRTDN